MRPPTGGSPPVFTWINSWLPIPSITMIKKLAVGGQRQVEPERRPSVRIAPFLQAHLANEVLGRYSLRSQNLTTRSYAISVSEHLENSIRRSESEESACFQTLQPGRSRRRQDDEGASPVFRDLLAYLPRTTGRHVRRRHRHSALGGWHELGDDGADPRARGL